MKGSRIKYKQEKRPPVALLPFFGKHELRRGWPLPFFGKREPRRGWALPFFGKREPRRGWACRSVTLSVSAKAGDVLSLRVRQSYAYDPSASLIPGNDSHDDSDRDMETSKVIVKRLNIR
jgi:hypothetical protein